MLPDIPSTYWYLAALRIVLVLVPQLGYIHPDEYFQSVEILAGRAFEVESSPPWEFNSTSPIRSMLLPFLTTGLAYRILLTFQYFLGEIHLITPYALLVAPRLLMCLSSFLVDFSLYKICVNNNEKYKNKLIILASSYVMIVYGTRTFSNTIELILFALLLYYVSESLTFSNILLKKKEYLNYRYESSKTTVEKVKFHKLRLYLTSDSLRNCLEISTITSLGFFNRPTFIAYAIFPIFFWLYRGIGSRLILPLNFHLRTAVFILCCIPTIILAVLIDSFYYSYLTWGEIGMLDLSINNFVFTPLNFVKYNSNSNNLARHGLHPRFLHLLVNIPLLFNVLAVYAASGYLKYIKYIVKGKHHLLPTVRSIKGLMALSCAAPVGLLSLFPHQEPRFLIPIILPLIYLFGGEIMKESDSSLVETTDTNHGVSPNDEKSNKKTNGQSMISLRLWFLLNFIFLVFFGFIHQGGVYPVTNHLSNFMKTTPVNNEFHLFTSHIYSIPESFLLQKSTEKLYFSRNNQKYSINKRAFLYEEGSQDLDLVLKKIRLIFSRIKHQQEFKPNKRFKVFLIIPGSLSGDKFNYYDSAKDLNFVNVGSFFPHLSTEAFSHFTEDILYFSNNFCMADLWTVVPSYFYKIFSSFTLELYEITLKN